MSEIDPLLVRQLKRLGIQSLEDPPDRETWQKALARISDHYRHVAEDRSLLTRSLELSTTEMSQLHQQLAAERDRLKGVITAIGDALNVFHDVASSRPEPTSTHELTGTITVAKRQFAAKLGEILAASAAMSGAGSDGSEVINDIRVNFLQLADRLVQLLYDTAEKASLKKQLEVARAVQQMLVPSEDVHDRSFLRIAAHFQPAAECGGDWWAVHDLPGDRVLTVIGDVTGHGISSAIITGAAKAACDLARTFSADRLTVTQLLRIMNCSIYEAAKQKFLMTATASIFDPASHTMTIANAGHPFPYIARKGSVRQIAAQGSPLGASSNADYQAQTVQLQPGDALLWFTDGVTECENEAREPFSDKRLRSLFLEVAPTGPERVRDAIVNAITDYRGSRGLDDDVTLVVAAVQ
ncbi:MAG TPA: PP2C family protein-serine/threonine phosphatase [Candidatus Nanopelagicales bacterium]|nr:PP2C family protein-serine/threonine phosphatase [Candidatus Nanopelagicales bacterium]